MMCGLGFRGFRLPKVGAQAVSPGRPDTSMFVIDIIIRVHSILECALITIPITNMLEWNQNLTLGPTLLQVCIHAIVSCSSGPKHSLVCYRIVIEQTIP